MGGTRWLSKAELDDKLRTTINATMYNNFVLAMEHLAHDEYAIVFKEFIMSYRTALKQDGDDVAKHAHTSEVRCDERA